MDVQHHLVGPPPVHREEHLQHFDDEIHRGEVVIEENDLIERRADDFGSGGVDGQAVIDLAFWTGFPGHAGSICRHRGGPPPGRPACVRGRRAAIVENGRASPPTNPGEGFMNIRTPLVLALLVLPLAAAAATTPDPVIKAQPEKKSTPYEIDEHSD